ncbi:cyclophilin-like protein [Ephemerocybe angulata]|uniref:Cyclophilin-like protein n=1 Tax=Ephemerocybe angulata TaxID=980116 RepID=A0A8H6MBW2_9AGAR|nr:cyclophilin-like protein [Tulosesus angulatus]
MALPTKGRVIIETTVGEIDIELWSKEAPKTCRNFLALAMEGYYDGVIFHRIMPGFLVQTGDRTGTGNGGESFYGDEIHPRLRYAHRGLVGMANNGTKDSNDSQFFITLDRADELHGKHTLFGRCMGDTVYNVMKIGEMEIDKDNRPVYPPKIKAVRIIDNPFDDIVPRITAAERRAQLKAREDAQKEREEEQRKKGAKKNVKLLSFGEDADAEEETFVVKKKAIFRPDLVDTKPESSVPIPAFVSELPPKSKASKPPASESPEPPAPKPSKKKEGKEKEKDGDVDITKIREKYEKEKLGAADSHRAQIERMEADIRKLSRRTAGDLSDDDGPRKKAKKSYLAEEMAKYTRGAKQGGGKKGKDKKDEGDIMGMLDSFRDKLRGAMAVDSENEDNADGEAKEEGEDDGMEVDDDTGFLGHSLHFPKGNEEEVDKAEREYEVIDPRARGAQAREEERERKRKEGKDKPRHGGGGRHHGAGGHRDGGRGDRDRGGYGDRDRGGYGDRDRSRR